MANSKYEYVKDFEADDRLPPHNWIVLRIDGCHFHRFSADHSFEKPNDKNALDLMNLCAVSMLEQFPDIVFAYGVSDEYSFILRETTKFYQRRASKIISLGVSYFTSVYVMKWKQFFPHKELKGPPYFDGRVVCYPRAKIIRDYLAWRQVDCHINNQYNTCFWMLVKSGKTEKEAQELLKAKDVHIFTPREDCFKIPCLDVGAGCPLSIYFDRDGALHICVWHNDLDSFAQDGYYIVLDNGASDIICRQGTQKKDKNELLFQQFDINYDDLPEMFRKGSSIYRIKEEEIVKTNKNGIPIRRMRSKVVVGHDDIIGANFWNKHPDILNEE